MSGAWETQHHGSVLCGILHVEQTTIAWAMGLRNLIIPGPVVPITGMPFDHARNAICMAGLDAGVDFVAMLDSDVVPPRDAFLRLMAHDVPLISGVYHRRSPPVGVPVMQRPVGQWVTELPQQGVIEVDVVGAGCLLISTDLLRSLPPISPQVGRHWFDWRVDQRSVRPPLEALSEDFAFCSHVRSQGHKVLVDCSIRCKHIGLAEADHGSFGPLNVIPAG